jgi:hypothetical protein
MTSVTALRIAAAISALFTAGHTMGGLKKWSPMGDNDVLRRMTDVHFQTMGANRSYLDFFLGFGWSITIAMLLQTVLLWQIGSLARENAAAARPMIAAFILGTIASAIIAWRYIFPVPALFAIALLAPLIWAYLAAA